MTEPTASEIAAAMAATSATARAGSGAIVGAVGCPTALRSVTFMLALMLSGHRNELASP
jgi:hypothetical protein